MEQNKDQIGAAVRGEAVAICPECGDVALCPRCDAAPVVVLTDAQIGNFWMNRDCMDAIRAGDVVAQFVSAFRAGMKALGVSARAADAPSEPSEKLYFVRMTKTDGWREASEAAYWTFSEVNRRILYKSRAADALDSQPTDGGVRNVQLMRFYDVETVQALIDAQEQHIAKLQAKLPRDTQSAFTRVREG